MKKHLKVFLAILKNNVIREMEFRSHFLMDFFVTLIWIASQLLIIEAYFSFTNNIYGWTKGEIFVLVGVFRTAKAVFDFLPRPNLFGLSNAISKGEIDYVLTRPINTLFIMSTRFIHINEILGIAIGVIVLSFGLRVEGIPLSLEVVLVSIIGCIFGAIAYYSLMLAIVTVSFYSTRLNSLPELHDFVSQTIRYPTDIFTKKNFLAELVIFPLAIICTLPAKIILGKLPSMFLIVEVVLSLGIFLAAKKFWNLSIKKYSSASS